MNLYHIQFDGEPCYVEAPSVAEAVEIWKRHTNRGDEEPESVALVHAGGVIRDKNAWLRR